MSYLQVFLFHLLCQLCNFILLILQLSSQQLHLLKTVGFEVSHFLLKLDNILTVCLSLLKKEI